MNKEDSFDYSALKKRIALAELKAMISVLENNRPISIFNAQKSLYISIDLNNSFIKRGVRKLLLLHLKKRLKMFEQKDASYFVKK